MPRQNTLTIRTPEGIVFSLALANPVARFLALAIDQICIYAISTLLTIILPVIGLINGDLAGGVWMLSTFILSLGYPVILEWKWRGQTIGKRVLRLQVMDEQGLRLQLSQIVIRNLLRTADALPAFYLVGGLACLFSTRSQRLGDMAANTIVVSQPRISEPDLDQLLPGKFNSFREAPHLTARLRQRVTPAEAGLALQALLRRETLDQDARLLLYGELRRRFEQITAFPQEITDGLSDEQYIRNVADILFRRR